MVGVTDADVHTDEDSDIRSLVSRLDLEAKVAVLTGASAWATTASAAVGLREMVMSDGPSGVRGTQWDERSPSLLLPCGTALASTWDVELARAYGSCAAQEARRKGVDVVLAPMINMHRSPLGGRNFEMFGEDPMLTGELAAAYIDGVQVSGIAACAKAYVANDFETDRYTADVRVSERALREVYLLPFEKAVAAHVWCVMSAYNSVNGALATESTLLEEPLTGEWGFDGVVVGDWTAVRTVESARHAQDLAMPGPGGPWGAALVAAVRAGDLAETTVDAKVEKILRLAARVGAVDGHPAPSVPPPVDGPEVARRVAADGMVLLRNDDALPLAPDGLHRIAVIGDNAVHARAQGGGSATVMPAYEISPLDGIRAALPDDVTIDFALGAVVQTGFAPLEPESMTNPISGGRGAQVTYLDSQGSEVFTVARFGAVLIDFGDAPGSERVASVVFETDYRSVDTATLRLGFACPGAGRMFVDGSMRLDETVPAGDDQVGDFFAPDSVSANVEVVAGQAVRLRYEFAPSQIVDGVEGSFSVWFGTQPAVYDEERLIADAARAAAAAETAIVVVGTNARVECEGYDRPDLRLPGRQDDLVRAVVAANPKTIVVVNSGAPVEMPWLDDAAAIVVGWFGGQEFGHALADVLFGVQEPGGRLPMTWPTTLAEVPVSDVTPQPDGVLRYDEGIHVGYRAWLERGVEPAYPFGFGLGYTTWELGEAAVSWDDASDEVVVSVEARNVGQRAGKQVLQVYAARRDSRVDRPRQWLVGFDVGRAAPGEEIRHEVRVPRRSFAYWDDGWTYEPGGFELSVGSSVADLGAPITVDLAAAG
jgi:beta-glucosidase